jgi:transposase
MTKLTIGIDISKDKLDVYRLPDGAEHTFPNDQKGLKALLRWLSGAQVERIVFEPTGPYHRRMERTLSHAGLTLCKVNPRHARRFAEALGKLAKTDRLDAAVLARFGEALKPEPTTPRDDILNTLRELHLARLALVKDRTAAKNRQKQQEHPLIKCQAKARLRHIEEDLKSLEEEMTTLVSQHAELARRLAILVSIPGVGAITALAFLIEMPELGDLGPKQAAALAGLAPIAKQSGQWRGKARIQGGRAGLRQALFMPALIACRYNPDLHLKYDALVAAGKPAKVAITAVMRKLVILANTLVSQDRNWEPRMA